MTLVYETLVIDGNDDESEISTVKFTFERIVGPYEIRSFDVDVTVRDTRVLCEGNSRINVG